MTVAAASIVKNLVAEMRKNRHRRNMIPQRRAS